MEREDIILSDAAKAMNYNAKLRLGCGNELKHQPCSYGIVLKWILGSRKITYAQFAAKLNNTTAQNLNHKINRADKSRFFDEDIEMMCEALKVNVEYFKKVSLAVEELMEKK